MALMAAKTWIIKLRKIFRLTHLIDGPGAVFLEEFFLPHPFYQG